MSLGQAVERQLSRLKASFPAHRWTPESLAEYRRVMTMLGDGLVVERAVTQAIDSTDDRYPPAVARIVAMGREIAPRRKAEASKPQFVEAAPHPFDPPGTVRWVAIQPDGSRVPKGARISGEM